MRAIHTALRGNGMVLPVAWVVSASLLVAASGDTVARALRFEREAIRAGDVWRWLSCHLVHLGWTHLALNAIALAIAAWLFGRLLGTVQWVIVILASATGVGFGLSWASPHIAWYVGLSGVGHGVVVAGSGALLRTAPASSVILLLMLAGKLAWEQLAGVAMATPALIGGVTVVDAHLYGALAGFLTWLVLELTGWKGVAQHHPPHGRDLLQNR